MDDCIFCKIAQGKISCNKVYEDSQIIVFNDLEPKAPVHVLIVPKSHIASMMDIDFENSAVFSHIFEMIPRLAKELQLEDGFRVCSNYGFNGGQSVEHIHFHLVGKRLLGPIC